MSKTRERDSPTYLKEEATETRVYLQLILISCDNNLETSEVFRGSYLSTPVKCCNYTHQ